MKTFSFKTKILLLAGVMSTTSAFCPTPTLHTTTPHQQQLHSQTQQLYMTTRDDTGTAPLMDLPSVKIARQDLIDTAERLKDEYGIFLIEPKAQEMLARAVEELESRTEPPAFHEWKKELLGEWELVCTSTAGTSNDKNNKNGGGMDITKLPFYDFSPLKTIRDSIRKTTNKYLKIQQIIRASGDNDSGDTIDRVDHVLQYEPPAELQDVLDNLPQQLSTVDINPLHISRSKLTLIHKAVVDNEDELLKVKLSLQSIKLNVAGTSTFLEPDGKDLAGINLPLSEFLSAGTFETTYMDEELRISRGKQGFVDVLRIFVRPGRVEKDANLRDIEDSDTSVGKGVDAEVDVDDFVDSEFEDSAPSDVEEE